MMSPEQQAAAEQAAVEQMFATPTVRPLGWVTQPGQLQNGEAVITLFLQTPESSFTVLLDRDSAIRLASQLRKSAQTGPQLEIPRMVVPQDLTGNGNGKHA